MAEKKTPYQLGYENATLCALDGEKDKSKEVPDWQKVASGGYGYEFASDREREEFINGCKDGWDDPKLHDEDILFAVFDQLAYAIDRQHFAESIERATVALLQDENKDLDFSKGLRFKIQQMVAKEITHLLSAISNY